MAITFQLPERIEEHLRQEVRDLDQAAKEATLVELYRQDKISYRELSEALGISRLEAEAVLSKHQVLGDCPTEEEHDRALSRLRQSRQR
jgi:predicted HTH domain antitoxin